MLLKAQKNWLLLCIAMVILMIIVGGYTRLTHSGLSIVEWKPVTGIFPPISNSDWNNEFLKYQNSPEFKKINYTISIEEFKEIFLVEYFHRLLGRITGFIFLIPFIYFTVRKQFSSQNIRYFLLTGFTFGMQGLFGWIMVKSGLIDKPNVSQYKLALHLTTACFIIILLQFKTLNIANQISKYTIFSICLLLLQIGSGAFVAGLKAGLIYNSFPLMNDELIPHEILFYKPWYINISENPACVQFIHRLLALINLINLCFYCYNLKNRFSFYILCTLFFQIGLGVATLLMHVPLLLALFHQLMAVVLLLLLIYSTSLTKN